MKHCCAADGPCPVPPHPLKLQRALEARRYGYTLTADPYANLCGTQFYGHPNTNPATGRPIGLNDGTLYALSSYAPNTSMATIVNQAQRFAPLRGAINILVVLVDFSDKGHAPSAVTHFSDLFFSTGRIATGSVNEYYREVSGNLISITGNVFGPYQLPNTSAYYSYPKGGMQPTTPNAETMANDTIDQMVRAGVNIAPYDNAGRYDRFVDCFIIVHAGVGAEEPSGNSDVDIWSHKGTLLNNRPIGNTSIGAYLTIPETAKTGVCAHEIGHLLFGWPDFYDTTDPPIGKGVGPWCLMSSGSWGGGGDRPSHPSAWCKAQQQWVDVIVPSLDSSTWINQQLDNVTNTKNFRTIYKLWGNPNRPDKEYFLAENRSASGFDQYLPGEGLLVWHVDDDVETSNTVATRPQVALENAAGDNDVFRDRWYAGESTNPFPSAHNYQVINGATYGISETVLFRPFLEKYYA